MQLAIDTSTETASLALSCEGEVKFELTWCCGQNHTVELLPSLLCLLQRADIAVKSIDAIAVARGPGSFNGLRVGIGTAKGLAYSLGIPIVGISTLEVEALPHASAGLPIYPIHNAGRGEIATALYQLQHEGWHQLIGEHITTLDVLCAQVQTRSVFCGELSPLMEAQLVKHLGERAIVARAAANLRRAGYLAELGWRRLAVGDFDVPATLQPLYLRRPPITQPRPRKPVHR